MRTRILLATAILLGGAVTAHAQWTLGTGVSITSGYTSTVEGETVEGGSDVGLYVWPRYQLSDNFTLGLRASFFGGSETEAAVGFEIGVDYSVIGALGTVEYNFLPDQDFQAFVNGELGFYTASADVSFDSPGTLLDVSASDSESYFAFGLGGGARYYLSDKLALEATLLFDFSDDFTLVPFNLGVVFNL